MCDLTHSYVWHESFIHATWSIQHTWPVRDVSTRLIHTCGIAWLVHTCDVTWLVCTRDRTHADVWHDSSTLGTWSIHSCDMTISYVCHDSLNTGMANQRHERIVVHVAMILVICEWVMPPTGMRHVTFMTQAWSIIEIMTHWYVWHGSFTCVTWLMGSTSAIADVSCKTCEWSWYTYEWVMVHIRMSHGTHTNESCYAPEWFMSHRHGLNEKWLDDTCDMAHSYVCHDPYGRHPP